MGAFLPTRLARRHVQQIRVFKCTSPQQTDAQTFFEPYAKMNGEECYLNEKRTFPLGFCRELIYVHGKGGKPFYFPEDIGIPIGESQNEYYMLETTYDNPRTVPNLEIEAGVEIIFSHRQKPNAASLIQVGYGTFGTFMIPPKSVMNIYGSCGSKCTSAMFPKYGANVFAALLQTRALGRRIRLQQFRGNQELKWIIKDDNYDSEFQQMRLLHQQVTILPGDQLATRCTYDSSSRNRTSFSGFSTQDETCTAYLYLSSRIPFFRCTSEYPTEKLLNRFGINNYTWDLTWQERYFTEPKELEGTWIGDVVDHKANAKSINPNQLQRDYQFSDHLESCPNIREIMGNYQNKMFKTFTNDWQQERVDPIETRTSYLSSTVTYPQNVREYQDAPNQCKSGPGAVIPTLPPSLIPIQHPHHQSRPATDFSLSGPSRVPVIPPPTHRPPPLPPTPQELKDSIYFTEEPFLTSYEDPSLDSFEDSFFKALREQAMKSHPPKGLSDSPVKHPSLDIFQEPQELDSPLRHSRERPQSPAPPLQEHIPQKQQPPVLRQPPPPSKNPRPPLRRPIVNSNEQTHDRPVPVLQPATPSFEDNPREIPTKRPQVQYFDEKLKTPMKKPLGPYYENQSHKKLTQKPGPYFENQPHQTPTQKPAVQYHEDQSYKTQKPAVHYHEDQSYTTQKPAVHYFQDGLHQKPKKPSLQEPQPYKYPTRQELLDLFEDPPRKRPPTTRRPSLPASEEQQYRNPMKRPPQHASEEQSYHRAIPQPKPTPEYFEQPPHTGKKPAVHYSGEVTIQQPKISEIYSFEEHTHERRRKRPVQQSDEVPVQKPRPPVSDSLEQLKPLKRFRLYYPEEAPVRKAKLPVKDSSEEPRQLKRPQVYYHEEVPEPKVKLPVRDSYEEPKQLKRPHLHYHEEVSTSKAKLPVKDSYEEPRHVNRPHVYSDEVQQRRPERPSGHEDSREIIMRKLKRPTVTIHFDEIPQPPRTHKKQPVWSSEEVIIIPRPSKRQSYERLEESPRSRHPIQDHSTYKEPEPLYKPTPKKQKFPDLKSLLANGLFSKQSDITIPVVESKNKANSGTIRTIKDSSWDSKDNQIFLNFFDQLANIFSTSSKSSENQSKELARALADTKHGVSIQNMEFSRRHDVQEQKKPTKNNIKLLVVQQTKYD